MGNILQSNEPCPSSLSYVFRVLWNSFSYPRDACITSSQTVFAFGELWPHSLCNLQVNLRYARLHKLSHYSRKTYGLSLCPLTVPEVFRSYQCLLFYCLFISIGYFKKKYSIVKITGNGHRKGAEQSVKVFLTRCGAAKLTHSRVVFLWGKLPTSSAQPRDIFARENS